MTKPRVFLLQWLLLASFHRYLTLNRTCCYIPSSTDTFLAVCAKTVLSYRWVWIVTKHQHKPTTRASPEHLFSTVNSNGRVTASGCRECERHLYMNCAWIWLARPKWLHWHMCILKTGRNSSLSNEKMMPALAWSVCGVAAFSIFLFLSCSPINSGECCCLSYFMCHWLPQSAVKNVHCVYEASSCLLLHSFPLPYSPFCCLIFSPLFSTLQP